ncbi:unnamed protein product, partial [Hapterophycus canaliculatus]
QVPLVTLVDTLDTLAIMGNATEFRRAVRLVADGLEVEADVDVSVFETNIRLLGGLLSAHLLALDPDLGLYSPDHGPHKRKHGSAGKGVGGEVGDEGELPLESCGGGGGRCFGNTDGPGGDNSSRRRAAARKGGGDKSSRDRGGGRGQDGWQGSCVEAEEREGGAGEDGEEEIYNGELLVLAERLGRRLLPAFKTPTGA